MGKVFEILYLENEKLFSVEPLPMKRNWMDDTNGKFSYKCIPLNIANQNGWQVLSPIEFCANWNGGEHPKDVEVHYHEESRSDFAAGHFGHGILTIGLDFIIRTPKGVSTHARGIPNYPIDGIYPLEGIIETDWLPFTFTFNYKFTRPGEVIFQKGQPLFSFFPTKRGTLEKYKVNKENISKYPEMHKEYKLFEKEREDRLNSLEPGAKNIQGFYSSGIIPKIGKISDPPQKQIKLDN